MKKQKRNKIKNVTIDNIITMQELASHLNSSVYNLYCSYLRQPISHDYIIRDNFIIHGNCLLDKEECSYSVSSSSYHGCDICNKYKEYFKRK